MRKILVFTTMFFVLGITVPAMAQVTIEVAPPPPPTVRVAVPLPPPIVFAAPPEVVVLPETEVYVVPSVPEEIFFSGGYWWRPWGGRWYRSLRYDGGWGVWAGVPGWYAGVYPGWRENYRLHLWGGHPWNYHHIGHADLHRNWRTWHNTGYWNRPEHREFSHSRDGRVYSGHLDKGRGERHVDKGATGAGQRRLDKSATGTGQAHVDKSTTGQRRLDKSTTGTGQGHVDKSATGAGQRRLDKSTTGTGQGHVDKGTTGQRHLDKGQHANEAEGRRK